MRLLRRGKLATNLAFMILMALATCYATTPAQITILGSDLGAAQGLPYPLLAPGLGIHWAPGVSHPGTFAPTIPAVGFGFYPADVSNPPSNPTLTDLTVHDIFVNPFQPSPGVYAQGTAGSPTLTDADTFSANLLGSTMIHITDQYTGDATPVRTVGQPGVITYSTYRTTFTESDIAILAHAAARTFGSGLGQFYHLYFAQGIDICLSGGGTALECYSPDNSPTFFFCAFHNYFKFADLGNVVFTVEPYGNVSGCNVPSNPAGASPNGPAIDSMANLVSHETFESISDPFLNAWFNRFGAFAGNEIGDECEFVFALPPVVLNGKSYQIQSEYSNFYHACSWVQ